MSAAAHGIARAADWQPGDEAEAAALVADAAARRMPVEIIGGGTKRGIGRPLNAAVTLASTRLTGIVAYEPTEMVMTARAGTPLSDVEAELARNGQRLAFEPVDWRGLLASSGTPTVGAVAAANISGPRRFVAGAARDSLLGVRFVNGAGEVVKNGGRVMKNVTGLDLVKLMAGSWGTLGFLTEVTFKVQPVPETEETLVLSGLSEVDGVRALATALGTHAEVSGAAHLPEIVNASVLDGALAGPGATLLRLEGFERSVAVRAAFLEGLFKDHAPRRLGKAASMRLWHEVGTVAPFAPARASDMRPVWRVSMAPDSAVLMVDALRRQAGLAAFYDWQGGLAWLRMEQGAEAGALRGTMARFGGGHATLVRADAATRGATAVFQPEPAPVAALSARVRAAFDPAGIFNSGRMG